VVFIKGKILVTAALPYANGPIHLGHLVEYIQADIFTRFLKMTGTDVAYCCADDTHGTPIEIAASKEGVSPEEFIKKWAFEHKKDFDNFHINFDSYYTTNSPENREFSDFFFRTLSEKGYIYKKKTTHLYCENCNRFLPDRFVKGKCPKCDAEDQYGDVCESCGATYKPVDLVGPYCSICKATPVTKDSEHYFFRLGDFSEKLKTWLVENKSIQNDIKNYVLKWIDAGLEDWCVSRDAPYFGFKIPGEENKYYYVWLDAPIGYIASTANYCKKAGRTVEDYWKNPETNIIHFIGKDIVYFHFLFWPAMLMGAGFNLPHNFFVHGFLTVNKEKFSKSRGTFITAKEFLAVSDPEFLRYYYASNLSASIRDIDLNVEDLREKVNNELVSNIANFAYRTLSFINNNFESRIGDIHLTAEDRDMMDNMRLKFKEIEKNYENCELREAVKCILEVSSMGNKYFQDNQPWALVKTDMRRCETVLNVSANILKNITILIKPILPEFAKKLEGQMSLSDLKWSDLGFKLKDHRTGKAEILLRKIDVINLTDPFSRIDLRVAEVKDVKDHPSADNLYILYIDVGEERQIVAGLKKYYSPEDLLGKKIVVICNLKPAKIRDVESNGMLLAADNKQDIGLVWADGKDGDRIFIDGVEPRPAKEIDVKEFSKLKLRSREGRVFYKSEALKTKTAPVRVDKKIDGDIV
jgi:methionyl-tRNA synthetase